MYTHLENYNDILNAFLNSGVTRGSAVSDSQWSDFLPDLQNLGLEEDQEAWPKMTLM